MLSSARSVQISIDGYEVPVFDVERTDKSVARVVSDMHLACEASAFGEVDITKDSLMMLERALV